MCQMSEIVSREGEAGPIGSRVRKSGSIGQNLVRMFVSLTTMLINPFCAPIIGICVENLRT